MPAGARADERTQPLVARREHPCPHSDGGVQPRERRRGGGTRGYQPRALHAPREVAVAEVEPNLHAERAQRVHDGERVAGQAPAARVDEVGEPEGDEVGVGRDVRAVDLDVISRVHDRRQPLGLDHVGHPPHELGAAGPAGEHDDVLAAHSHRPSRRPVSWIPA